MRAFCNACHDFHMEKSSFDDVTDSEVSAFIKNLKILGTKHDLFNQKKHSLYFSSYHMRKK